LRLKLQRRQRRWGAFRRAGRRLFWRLSRRLVRRFGRHSRRLLGGRRCRRRRKLFGLLLRIGHAGFEAVKNQRLICLPERAGVLLARETQHHAPKLNLPRQERRKDVVRRRLNIVGLACQARDVLCRKLATAVVADGQAVMSGLLAPRFFQAHGEAEQNTFEPAHFRSRARFRGRRHSQLHGLLRILREATHAALRPLDAFQRPKNNLPWKAVVLSRLRRRRRRRRFGFTLSGWGVF